MEMSLIRATQDRQAGAAVGFSYAQVYINEKLTDLADAVRRDQEESNNQPKQ